MNPLIEGIYKVAEDIMKKFTYPDSKFEFYRFAFINGIFRTILRKIYEKIDKDEKDKDCEQKELRRKKIDHIHEQVKGYLNAKNDKEYGLQKGVAIAENVEVGIFEQFSKKMRKNLVNFLLNRWPSPEEALRYAYQKSFTENNYENALKYVLKPDQFINEIVREEVNKNLENFYENTNERIRNNILEELEDIQKNLKTNIHEKKVVLKTVEDIKPILKDFNSLKSKLEGPAFTNSIAINDSSAFGEGIEIALEKRKEEINSTISVRVVLREGLTETNIERAISYFVGCTSTCNLCGAKCIRGKDHTKKGPDKNHKALHQLCVFGGWRFNWFHTPMLISCKKATQGLFFDGDRKSWPMLNYIKDCKQDWLSDLSDSVQIDTDESLLSIWANIRKPFQRENKMIDFLPSDVRKLEKANSLPQDFILPKYFSAKFINEVHKATPVDVVFLLDCTKSMKENIKKARKSIDKIMNLLKSICDADMQVGFVGYREHPQNDDATPITILKQLTSDTVQVKEFIEKEAKPIGGGDLAEAVADGLYLVNEKIEWRKDSNKFIFHILDAPPHGEKYHYKPDLPQVDFYMDGCPCGHDCIEILKEINRKKITYCMITVIDSVWGETYPQALDNMKILFKEANNEMYIVELNDEKGVINNIYWLLSKRVGIGERIKVQEKDLKYNK